MNAYHDWANRNPFQEDSTYEAIWNIAITKKVESKIIFSPVEVTTNWDLIQMLRKEHWINRLKENHQKYTNLHDKFGNIDL
jgi:hypothetical protein